MPVAFDAVSAGNSVVNAKIEHGTIGTTSTTFGNGCTITIGATATTCIVFILWNNNSDGTWTVTVGGSTATELSGSFKAFGGGATAGSVRAFEVKNPPTGASKIVNVANSAAGAGLDGYVFAISFTGSDTGNASTAWSNNDGGTASTPASTGASPSSIPTGDMACDMFANPVQGFSTNVTGFGNTGGATLVYIDTDEAITNNAACTRISGNNNTITLTAQCNASTPTADNWAAVGVWVQAPAGATLGDGMPLLMM